jgi:hypothetical protein
MFISDTRENISFLEVVLLTLFALTHDVYAISETISLLLRCKLRISFFKL